VLPYRRTGREFGSPAVNSARATGYRYWTYRVKNRSCDGRSLTIPSRLDSTLLKPADLLRINAGVYVHRPGSGVGATRPDITPLALLPWTDTRIFGRTPVAASHTPSPSNTPGQFEPLTVVSSVESACRSGWPGSSTTWPRPSTGSIPVHHAE
jgi:hypothetical protein